MTKETFSRLENWRRLLFLRSIRFASVAVGKRFSFADEPFFDCAHTCHFTWRSPTHSQHFFVFSFSLLCCNSCTLNERDLASMLQFGRQRRVWPGASNSIRRNKAHTYPRARQTAISVSNSTRIRAVCIFEHLPIRLVLARLRAYTSMCAVCGFPNGAGTRKLPNCR